MSSLSKTSADRQKRALQELLALPGNSVCADCSSPAPRWTSWNIGIFICVQCATAHRKLGSHISKVRSVTLDTWTKEQVESMKNMGNTKANALYNPDPLRNPPPTNMEDSERDSELETYIRNKYQYKAFMKKDAALPTRSNTTRPPDILIREPARTPSRAGTSPGKNSYREAIDAASPIASSLIADMESHTRKLSTRVSADRSRDRARSTPPTNDVGGKLRPSTASDMAFTTVGVTPPQVSSRPSTASSRLGASSSTLSATGTKPRTATISGGFSWTSTSSTTTTSASATSSASARPTPTAPAPVVPAPVNSPPKAPEPKPTPVPSRSLYEEDMLSLQFGTPAPATNQMPTNPFPMTSSATPLASASIQNVSQLGSPFVSSNPTGSTLSYPGSVQSLSTGFSSMSLGSTASAPNPFTGLQQSQSPPPMQYPSGILGQQVTGAMLGSSPFNPFTQMTMGTPFNTSNLSAQSTQSSVSQFQASTSPFQTTSAPFQTAPSPFQAIQPSPSPFQSQLQSHPTGISPSPFAGMQPSTSFASSNSFTSPSPFQTQQPTAGPYQSPSPFQSLQQQQPQFTGAPAGFGTHQSNFASFAQGMLPPSSQNQQSGYNPFAQSQQQQQQQMGVNGWMR